MKRTVLESCICTLSHSSAWVRARAHTLPNIIMFRGRLLHGSMSLIIDTKMM